MADIRIPYTDELVGFGHPTKTDNLNRGLLVGHDSSGYHENGIRGASSTGSARFTIDISNANSLTMAAGSTAYPFTDANNFSGLILITDISAGGSALFLAGGAVNPVEIADSLGYFSAASGTTSQLNVYLSSSYGICMENRWPTAHVYRIMAFRTRPGL